MGYKLLGYVVWKGGKWYLRRQLRGHERQLAVAAGGAGLVLAGGAAAFVATRRAKRG